MNQFLKQVLFSFGDYHLKVSMIVVLFSYLTITIVAMKIFKKIIYGIKSYHYAKQYSIYNLVKYFIVVISFVISFQILGFNASVLLAGSAALLVGLGLGIQNLFSDYISGIIILIDSSVKVGDVLEINGLVCKVQEIKIRTTMVLTRDDKNIILPNSDLTRNQLINWTLNKEAARFDVSVGVDYASNVNLVIQLMEQACNEHKSILKANKPIVRLNEFENSSLKFNVYFWSNEVFRIENIKSDLRLSIFSLFKENNIKIPFPQHVIHTEK